MLKSLLNSLAQIIHRSYSDTVFQAKQSGYLEGEKRFREWLLEGEGSPAPELPQIELPHIGTDWKTGPTPEELEDMDRTELRDLLHENGNTEARANWSRAKLLEAIEQLNS